MYSDGDPNTDISEKIVTVRPDNEDPYVSFEGTFTGVEKDATAGGTPVWHRYTGLPFGLEYPGVEYCAEVHTYDNQIGVESALWDNFNDELRIDGVDKKCIQFNEYPNNEVFETSEEDRQRTEPLNYTAWDFSQNSKTYTRDVEVKHDNTDPAVSQFKLEQGSLFDAKTGYSQIFGRIDWVVGNAKTFWWEESKNPDSLFVSTDEWSGHDILLDAETVDYGDSGEPAIGVACNIYSTSLTSEVFGGCSKDQNIFARWLGGGASNFGAPNRGSGDYRASDSGYADVFTRQPGIQLLRNCAQNTNLRRSCFKDTTVFKEGNSDRVITTKEKTRVKDPDDPGDYDWAYKSVSDDKYDTNISDSAVTVKAEQLGANKEDLNILSEGIPIEGGYKIGGAITSTVYDWHGNNKTERKEIDFIYDTTPPVVSGNASSDSPDYRRDGSASARDEEINDVAILKAANCVDVSDEGPNGGVGVNKDTFSYRVFGDEKTGDGRISNFNGALFRGNCAFVTLEVNANRPPIGLTYNPYSEEFVRIRSSSSQTEAQCVIEYFGGPITDAKKLEIIDKECPDKVLTIDDFGDIGEGSSRVYYGDGGCYGDSVSSISTRGEKPPACNGFDDDVDFNMNPSITDNHGNQADDVYAAVWGYLKDEGRTKNNNK